MVFLEQSRTKFTSDFYSRKRPDDDDDFVNQQPVTIPIQKIVKNQTRMANPGKVEDSLRYLNTRFPPEHITKTMALLNNGQRKCVESIGFGSALNIQLEKLSRTICYWVFDNYDPNINSIRVKDKRLVVTRERLFYLSFKKVEDATIQSPTTGMMYWTTDMLDKRELEELSKGGFGSVIIPSQHISKNHTKQEDGEDDDATGSKRDCKSPAGFIEHVVQETSQSENDADNNLKDIMSEINIEFNACDNALRAIHKLLMQGINQFPDSVELHMLVTKTHHEFNLAWPDFSTSVDSHDETFFNGAATPVMQVRDNTVETKVDQFTEAQMADEPLIDVVCTPFTQILNADAFDMMLESAFDTSTRLSTPSDHVEPNIKIDDVNAVPVTIVVPRWTSRLVVSPVTVMAPRRTRRLVQLTEKLRSPYSNRALIQTKFLDQSRRECPVGFSQGWTRNGTFLNQYIRFTGK
ncbi:unnamed protein product [Lactuca saligna]|uniref:Uncharacterized protein n=1 Tax=Lactuca saligna TaxID=75948 RepID=A0AA35YRJ1_LACSI|nr:unnamed protein product [Lactuca saligna]